MVGCQTETHLTLLRKDDSTATNRLDLVVDEDEPCFVSCGKKYFIGLRAVSRILVSECKW